MVVHAGEGEAAAEAAETQQPAKRRRVAKLADGDAPAADIAEAAELPSMGSASVGMPAADARQRAAADKAAESANDAPPGGSDLKPGHEPQG